MSGKYTVGQAVTIYSGQQRDGGMRATVTRLGRSLVFVQGPYGREWSFRMSDGVDNKHNANTPGPASFIRTADEEVEILRRDAVKQHLFELGIGRVGYADFRHSTETLEKIAALIEAEGGTDV